MTFPRGVFARVLLAAAIVLSVLLALPVSAHAVVQAESLRPLVALPDPLRVTELHGTGDGWLDHFGSAIAVSGDTAIIGAPGGEAAYVYRRAASGWVLEASLTATDSAASEFGVSVALDGDTAVVGALRDEARGRFSGSAHVFRRSGTAWTRQAKLVGSDETTNDCFGITVAVSGDSILVGAAYQSGGGAVYAFQRTGTTWNQQGKYTVPAEGDAGFGSSASISGDTAVIGARGGNGGRGSAFVFTRFGGTWVQQARLVASDGAPGDYFGHAVAISGDTVVVGAFFNGSTATSAGAAYVYTGSGTAWNQRAKLTASDATASASFGEAVAVSGDRVMVGALAADEAYLFGGQGASWQEQARFTDPSGAKAEYYGSAVAVSEDAAFVGAFGASDLGPASGSAFAIDLAYRTSWNTAIVVPAPGVLANDVDAGGDLLSASLVSAPAHGTLVLLDDGSFVYTPAQGFLGADSFTYRAFDGTTYSSPVTATIEVVSTNHAPSFVPGGDVIVSEDSAPYSASWASSISAGPPNEASQTLTFTTVNSNTALFSTQPTIAPDGTLSFTPAPLGHGSAEVTVTLTDDDTAGGPALSHVETFTITVLHVNHAPVARPDTLTLTEDTPLDFPMDDLLANDSDVDGDALIAAPGPVRKLPKHGWIWQAGRILTYVPDPDFNGSDEFAYCAYDGELFSDPVTVTVTVTPVNDPPSFAPGGDVVVNEDSARYSAPWASVISAGPANEASQALTFTTANSNPALFSVQPTVAPDGTLSFTPAPLAHGSAEVTVTLTDDDTAGGPALSHVETFTITVLHVNHAPTAVSDAATTTEDTTLTVAAPGVLANDSDPDGDSLTATLVATASHGSVDLRVDGSFAYVPAPDFNGTDTFTYRASDGTTSSAPGTVTVTVTPVNDAPVALDDTATCEHGATLTLAAPGVLENDRDIDGDSLTATLAASPSHGTVTLSTDGSFTYVPAAEFSGVDSFRYLASDGTTLSSPATVTITMKPPVHTAYSEAAGPNRFTTAAEVSRRAFPSGATTVVVATGRNWPDALGASALAGALHAPIILSDTDSIPASSAAEIARLGARDAVVIGSEKAVGRTAFSQLQRTLPGTVKRIAGSDRYATGDAVASATVAALGDAYDGRVLLATGGSYPDALAASPLAAAEGWPVFLAQPEASPASVIDRLRTHGATDVVILGGEAAIPLGAEDSCRSAFGASSVLRLGGANRYETAATIAKYGVGTCGLRWDGLALATGADFPDALAGGVAQGRAGSVLLLTTPTALHPSTRQLLFDGRDAIHSLVYLGSERAVSAAVRAEVAQTLH